MRGKFDDRFKSVIDEDKFFMATPIHEMAHALTSSYTARKEFVKNISSVGSKFWNDLKKLRTEYMDEKNRLFRAGNASAYNKIFLGRYANKNADEFFAEAWTEFHLSSTPSPYAIKVGQLIKKHYGK